MNKDKKRRTANDMIPGDLFHPGSLLGEEIACRGIKQTELAENLGISKSEMSLLINGKRNFTVPFSVKLEAVLGIKAELWMKIQMRYEIDVVRKRMANELKGVKMAAKRKAAIRTSISHAA